MNTASGRRAFWLKHLHAWHWVSSAICLIGMILFAITGITLNHASAIEASPVTRREAAAVPALAVRALEQSPRSGTSALPAELAGALTSAFGVSMHGREAEWSEDEVYVALPQPGGDAFVTVDRATGDAEYERTDRGWISYLNDLHKGRNTGAVWKGFLDVFAAGCVVFCVTGLVLLQMHARQRPTTWPLVGLGLVVPLLIGLLLIH